MVSQGLIKERMLQSSAHLAVASLERPTSHPEYQTGAFRVSEVTCDRAENGVFGDPSCLAAEEAAVAATSL